MKKGIALFLASFVLVFSISTAQVYADINTPQILDLLPGFDITEIYEAYSALDSVQSDICCYLIGLYNAMYLGARGFNFTDADYQSYDTFTGKLRTFGEKVMAQSGLDGWRSRMNRTFCIYMSSCIQYAMNQDYLSFNDWYQDLPANFYLPYSSDAFNAWDNYYNDPTNDGIASFGSVVTNWNSGTLYDFDFVGWNWQSDADQQRYNDFVINNSPVIYSNPAIRPNYSSYPLQYVFNPHINGYVPDSLFVLRSAVNAYQFFTYGFSYPMSPITSTQPISCILYRNSYTANLRSSISTVTPRSGAQSYNSAVSLDTLIHYAFEITPFNMYYNSDTSQSSNFHGFYPFIEHVYLVDDLTTLANPEEIFDVEDLGIESNSKFRLSPNGRFIFPIKCDLPELPEIKQWFIDNSKTDEGDDVDDNDFTQIVNNNTVINNYYPVNQDTPINIDVSWFTRCSDFVTYLWDNSVDFVHYCADLLECLTFTDGENSEGPSFIIYGALVFGVAGGVVSKLLL